MKKIALVALLALSLLLPAFLAMAQDDLKEIKSEAFGKLQRPAVAFDHNAHNEKAQIEDCLACHHSGENGVQDKTTGSEGTPCSECHKVKPADKKATSLMRAYHKQCINCHTEKKKGPLACGECHVRKK